MFSFFYIIGNIITKIVNTEGRNKKLEKRTEEKREIEEKLQQIGLNIEKIPNIFEVKQKIRYKPLKGYDNTNYKVYHFVDIRNIEIYLTKATRLEETDKKYKLAEPLLNYLQPENEELLENYVQFLKLLKELDLDKLKDIDLRQKKFQAKIPFEVKYKENFIWEIYYSEVEDKYFMMFPIEEEQVEALFYLIKKQIELQKSKKTELIYVPINNMEYTSSILKKSEIADLENYLWYFTKSWPSIYEVREKDKTTNIQIVGKLPVYDKVKSIYKIKWNTKEEAQKELKRIKALFILQSHAEEEYFFQTGINEAGGLNFYFNHNQITYENLAEFIQNEVEKKKEKIEKITQQNLLETEHWLLLKETVQKQNIEYSVKEKQIVTFLECKRTFLGKVSYFFKSKKKKKQEEKQEVKKVEEGTVKLEKIGLEEKKFYTIEDLLKVCTILEEKEKEYKNKQMDIKALENKKENLERKIQNATLYINEIESHKKSIFDFWKFTNKDELPLLLQGEEGQEKETKQKIKKSFSYEEDIEEVGKKIDQKQRSLFSEKECDAIFAIYQDIEAFNIERKEKKLKKDEKYLEKSLKEKQEEYERNFEALQEKDFDIFGSVIEDKTKIKVLKNQKHREIERDPYKILDIHPSTKIEEYQDTIHHYQKILEKADGKMTSPYDIPIYLASKKTLECEEWIIMNMDPKKAIQKWEKKENCFVLNRINVKENMPAIFYSNIMFYGNLNQTLPEGMDIETEVLLDLQRYEMKLVSRKDFKMNFLENEFENQVKEVQVYEYDIERKETK